MQAITCWDPARCLLLDLSFPSDCPPPNRWGLLGPAGSLNAVFLNLVVKHHLLKVRVSLQSLCVSC